MPPLLKFRQDAVQHYNSPAQLEQLIRVVTPHSWLIALTFYVLLLGVIIWSIIGSIPTRAEGKGILLASGGDIYNAVAPEGSSYVSNFLVKPGDKVKKGQILVYLSRPMLIDELRNTQHYIDDLLNKRKQLDNMANDAIAKRQKEIDDQRLSLQRATLTTQEKLKRLKILLELREAALKKGIEIRQNVESTYQEYYGIQNELETYKDKLIDLDIDNTNFRDQWQERLRQLTLTITEETIKLHNLQSNLKLSTKVVSPITGMVIDLRANVGSIVTTGQALVGIASEGKELDALVFLPPKTGKRIKLGMKALISPNTVEKAEYGSIQGSVINVAAFPATSQTMIATLQNEELVKEFSQNAVPIAVRVHLQADVHTFSGLKWTSSQGPSLQITPGTVVSAMITIKEQAPITLIIPALKKIGGVE